MDCRSLINHTVRGLLFIISTLLSTTQLAVASEIRLPQELSWLKQNAYLAKNFHWTSQECINTDVGPQTKQAITLGRVAFNSPRLLGGQAGRIGLNCASCHISGRNNPHFFIDGISTRPGTADVTHSFLSSGGGDQQLNAVTIPDLADRSQNKIKDRQSAEFDAQLIRLIEVEFDGQPANQTIFNAVKRYLINTDTRFCDQARNEPKTVHSDWRLVNDAVSSATIALQENDQSTFKFSIAAARAQLERIYYHFGLLENKKIDATLIKSSRKLERTLDMSNEKAKQRLQQWQGESERLYSLLRRHQDKSAYSESALRTYLENRNKSNP